MSLRIPIKRKIVKYNISQDVEVEESPAPVCCTIVTMFCCENKYYKKPASKLTRSMLQAMQETWVKLRDNPYCSLTITLNKKFGLEITLNKNFNLQFSLD